MGSADTTYYSENSIGFLDDKFETSYLCRIKILLSKICNIIINTFLPVRNQYIHIFRKHLLEVYFTRLLLGEGFALEKTVDV